MNQIKKSFESPKKLIREEVENRLAAGENLENLILTDLDLSGLNFERESFCRSDIRGMRLYREEQDRHNRTIETRTNIRGANFTDTIIADYRAEVFFVRVDAEGAVFGYTEDLISRRERHQKTGRAEANDTGGLFNFNGSEGNFRKTKWINVDFGGIYGAIFNGADLSEAIIERCDLSDIDFSETIIDNIKIIDPVSLRELRINENQIESLAQAIRFIDQERQAEFSSETVKRGSRKALEECFGVIIVDIQDNL